MKLPLWLSRTLPAAVLAVSTLAGGTEAQARTMVKFATVDCEGNLMDCPYFTYTEVFNQMLTAGTGGRYELQTFPNSQMGDLESLTEQTARGIVEMSAGQNAGLFAGDYPNVQIVEMPYAFPSLEIGRDVLHGAFGRELADGVAEASGVRILSWLPSAFRSFTNDVRPIRSPADMEGLKIRVQPMPIHLRLVETLGGSVTPIAWGALYNALQTGVVDGQENAPYVITLGHLEEVQSYHTLDRHLMNLAMVTINEEFYQGLPEEDRAVFDETASTATFAMLARPPARR